MDPLSITVSGLAIFGALNVGINAVNDLIEAPNELKELSIQYRQLDMVVANAIEVLETGGAQRSGPNSFEPIINRLESARTTFNTRLSKRKDGIAIDSFSRRICMKRGREIKKLTKDLIAIRKDLVMALNLSILSSSCALEHTVDHKYADLTLQIRQLRNDIRSSNVRVHLPSTAVAWTALNNHLELDARNEEAGGRVVEEFLDAASHYAESISDAVSFRSACSSFEACTLERSSFFYPEQYIIEQQHMVVTCMTELYQTATSRVDKYYLIYPTDARHWRRVIVLAISSKHLNDTKVASTFQLSHKTLPGSLQPQLESYLRKTTTYDTVTRIDVKLDMDMRDGAGTDFSHSEVCEDLEAASMLDTSSYLEEIRFQGLPQYLESEISFVARQYSLFVVLVKSQLCCEYKIPFRGQTTTDPQPTKEFLEGMKLLLSMQGCTGVPKFIGVVLNDERTQIRSYLLQAPRQGPLKAILVKSMQRNDPPMRARRERWFRQLLAITADVHRRGMVVGHDPQGIWHLWVDSDDNIKIMTLVPYLSNVPDHHGYLAPEIRSGLKAGSVSTSFDVSTPIDVFNLGFLLWRIVQHGSCPSALFCRRYVCTAFPHHSCTADHANPIALPLCDDNGGEMPNYISTVIGHCRQENPSDRKPVAELLKLLPPENATTHLPGATLEIDPWQGPDHAPLYPTCDECGAGVAHEAYHCNVCYGGDFDLCANCVKGGVPCNDHSHTLFRRVLKNGEIVNEPLGSPVAT